MGVGSAFLDEKKPIPFRSDQNNDDYEKDGDVRKRDSAQTERGRN